MLLGYLMYYSYRNQIQFPYRISVSFTGLVWVYENSCKKNIWQAKQNKHLPSSNNFTLKSENSFPYFLFLKLIDQRIFAILLNVFNHGHIEVLDLVGILRFFQ